MNASEEELKAEFEALARRAGIAIPEDRRAAFFAGFKDFRRMARRMHAPRGADVETASVFVPDTARKG